MGDLHRRPTWFIVGAPKAGTTAWYTYLRTQPKVFLPDAREVHFFAADLLAPGHRMLNAKYVDGLYARATPEQSVGQVGIFYMYSRVAARRIKEFDPTAKIIAMIRNPVDLMYSLHAQLIYNGQEDLHDFRQALEAEERRASGLAPAPQADILNKFRYRDIARLAEQLQRFLDEFGRKQVHVVVYDDLKRDTPAEFAATLEFLELPPLHRFDLTPVNPNKETKSRLVRDLLLHNPPRAIRTIAGLLPDRQRWRLREAVRARNTRYVARPPMPPDLRRRLQSEFAAEIDRLSGIVDRDLSSWYIDSPDS